MLEAECLSCEARQPLNFPAMIERFGPGKTLADVMPDLECRFCHKPGIKVIEIDVGR